MITRRQRSLHHTKRGPGRQHTGDRHPAGVKLIRRFIRDAMGENLVYRRDLQALTGRTKA